VANKTFFAGHLLSLICPRLLMAGMDGWKFGLDPGGEDEFRQSRYSAEWRVLFTSAPLSPDEPVFPASWN